jgi:hypothetical protein
MRLRAFTTTCALLVAGLAPLAGHAAGATDIANVPAALVGAHGPTEDVASNLTVVGHSDIAGQRMLNGKLIQETTPLGNNGGIALIGDCAFVGRWHEYDGKYPIQIVDVKQSSPTFMKVVGIVDGSVVSGGVSREIRAIDLPGFKMLTVLVFNQGLPDRTHNTLLYFTFVNGDCHKPVLAGSYDMGALRGHEFYQWLDPKNSVNGHPRVLDYVTTPVGPVNIVVVDASDPAKPALAGVYQDAQPVASATEVAGDGLGNYAHSISLSPDGTEAYVSDWDGGFFTLDTTAFTLGAPAGAFAPKGAMSAPLHYVNTDGTLAFGNTHSAVAIPGTNTMVVGDEIYSSTDGCPFGWMRTIDRGSPALPALQIGEFRLPENNASACGKNFDPASNPFGFDPFNFDATVLLKPAPLAHDRNANGDPVVGTFSMHNQTVTPHYVVTSWYGGGLRVVDVHDPAHPAQAGMFVPRPILDDKADDSIKSTPATSAPPYPLSGQAGAAGGWWVSMWSYPIIRDGLIYVSDMRNGLYVLRPAPGAPFAQEIAGIKFAEGNSNFGAFVS